MTKYTLAGFIVITVILLDQITKFLVIENMLLNQSIIIIKDLLHITYIRNAGAAFGLLEEMETPFFLIASSIAILIVFIYLVRTPKDHAFLIGSLSFIFGGAIGNMIDRVRFGEVIDFIDLQYKGHHWPAFNISDSAITIGIGLLFLNMIFGKKKR